MLPMFLNLNGTSGVLGCNNEKGWTINILFRQKETNSKILWLFMYIGGAPTQIKEQKWVSLPHNNLKLVIKPTCIIKKRIKYRMETLSRILTMEAWMCQAFTQLKKANYKCMFDSPLTHYCFIFSIVTSTTIRWIVMTFLTGIPNPWGIFRK